MLSEKVTKMDLDKPEIPAVGDGVTYGSGSDCYPGTVIEVQTIRGKVVVTIQNDDCRVVNRNANGDGLLEYFPNPNGRTHHYRLEWLPRYGRWVWQGIYQHRDTGCWRKSGRPGGVGFGQRRYYMDPHF